jgi:cellulose biosynthesis protein BcsQ
LAGDARGAWGVVEAALAAGAELEEIYLDVLAPAMAAIGPSARGDVVMLDLPAGQSAYLDQALQAADQVVAVVTPDAGSFLALEHMRQALHGRNNCRYIVNKYNAARTFSQDMLEVLKRWMGSRLAGVIALDHAISEGLAYGFNPLVKAGHSPAYDQLRTISEQLHAEVVKSALAGGRAS